MKKYIVTEEVINAINNALVESNIGAKTLIGIISELKKTEQEAPVA